MGGAIVWVGMEANRLPAVFVMGVALNWWLGVNKGICLPLFILPFLFLFYVSADGIFVTLPFPPKRVKEVMQEKWWVSSFTDVFIHLLSTVADVLCLQTFKNICGED
jgi:hypothetical protein